MGLFDATISYDIDPSSLVDTFGVAPGHDRGDVETLGSPTETSRGGFFGFLGKAVEVAKLGADVAGSFQSKELERTIAAADATKEAKATTEIPVWVWLAGGALVLLVFGVLAFKK